MLTWICVDWSIVCVSNIKGFEVGIINHEHAVITFNGREDKVRGYDIAAVNGIGKHNSKVIVDSDRRGAIKKALEDGKELIGAEIVENQSMIIK